MLLGEMLDGDPSQVARVWRDGHFTAMFDFPLAFAIADVFCRDQPLAKLAAVLTNDRRYPDPSQLVTLVDNHDLPRIASLCGHDSKRIQNALSFLLASRGIPSLTWGTEIGLDGDKEPDNRKSMRFVPTPLKAELTKALTLRSENPALSDGSSTVLFVDAQHLVIGRAHPSELSVIVVNQSSQPFDPRISEPWPHGPSSPGVSVFNTHGDFTGLSKTLAAQWRTGAKTSPVTFTSKAPGKVVGSGSELGDWAPAKGVTLPATLDLPIGGVFELKFVAPDGTWGQGENHVVFVKAEPQTVELP